MPRIASTILAVLIAIAALLPFDAVSMPIAAARPTVGDGDLAPFVEVVAARKATCTRARARAGLCRVRPSSATPRLRQPAPLPPCPQGQIRAGVRCVGPTPQPPPRPVPEIGRCLGGTWMGAGCHCPAGRIPQQLGRNFYSCGTASDCPGGGRRIGTQCGVAP